MVGSKGYVPDVGDIIWLEFDPQSGHEQKGHRPALVLSPLAYNAKAGLIVCCPMTTHPKGYPFEVMLNIAGVESVVLADQIKSVDWRARNAKLKDKVTVEALTETKAKIKALLAI